MRPISSNKPKSFSHVLPGRGINCLFTTLIFTSLSNVVPPGKAAIASLGNGKYTLQGGYLGLPEKWDIKVVVIRPGKFDAYGDFKFDLSQSAGMPMR